MIQIEIQLTEYDIECFKELVYGVEKDDKIIWTITSSYEDPVEVTFIREKE